MTLTDYFILALTLLIIAVVVSTIIFFMAILYFKLKKLYLSRKAPKDLYNETIKKGVLSQNVNKSQEDSQTSSS